MRNQQRTPSVCIIVVFCVLSILLALQQSNRFKKELETSLEEDTHYHASNDAGELHLSDLQTVNDVSPAFDGCRSAWAHDSQKDLSLCFEDLQVGDILREPAAAVGWINGPFSTRNTSVHELDLYAGSGDCDPKDGEAVLVGNVRVSIRGGNASVMFATLSDTMYELTATSLYIDEYRMPVVRRGDSTFNSLYPNDFPYQNDIFKNPSTDTLSIKVLRDEVYIMANAEVCAV